ncbi:MAG: cytochrome c family protein [Blastochloris viridis]|uniref:Cytochrome c family protein n=1 Tax=Blastochloris viridis TaxID=1079 RepID=A0A6N4RA45_BLAVI|nr:MAG: cytochrome c family protein [Blastochloris viridis]
MTCSPSLLFGMVVALLAAGVVSVQADTAAGEKVFAKCKVCHTATKGGPNRVGPNLFGIVGRGVAENATFKYSAAMMALKGTKTWTEAELDAYLSNPKGKVAGTKMIFVGIPNKADRAHLIEWLKTQK